MIPAQREADLDELRWEWWRMNCAAYHYLDAAARFIPSDDAEMSASGRRILSKLALDNAFRAQVIVHGMEVTEEAIRALGSTQYEPDEILREAR